MGNIILDPYVLFFFEIQDAPDIDMIGIFLRKRKAHKKRLPLVTVELIFFLWKGVIRLL
jgi:hypothetical protein